MGGICSKILWCRGEAFDECDVVCQPYGGYRSVHTGGAECGPGDCICWSTWRLQCTNGYLFWFECGEYDEFECEVIPPKK